MTAIGVLGGTFDPVHCGHLRLALEVAERLALDEMHLLPAPNPRLREAPRSAARDRLALLVAATGSLPALRVDPRELDREGPTFTVDTLSEIRAERPDASISFVLGVDAFGRIDRWHRWEALLELAHLVVAARPGARTPSGSVAADLLRRHRATVAGDLARERCGRVLAIEVPPVDVSATAIRERIAAGRSIHCLVPDAVRLLIEKHGMYTDA